MITCLIGFYLGASERGFGAPLVPPRRPVHRKDGLCAVGFLWSSPDEASSSDGGVSRRTRHTRNADATPRPTPPPFRRNLRVTVFQTKNSSRASAPPQSEYSRRNGHRAILFRVAVPGCAEPPSSNETRACACRAVQLPFDAPPMKGADARVAPFADKPADVDSARCVMGLPKSMSGSGRASST